MPLLLIIVMVLIIYGVVRYSHEIVDGYINDAINEERLERYRHNRYNH